MDIRKRVVASVAAFLLMAGGAVADDVAVKFALAAPIWVWGTDSAIFYESTAAARAARSDRIFSEAVAAAGQVVIGASGQAAIERFFLTRSGPLVDPPLYVIVGASAGRLMTSEFAVDELRAVRWPVGTRIGTEASRL